MSYEFRVQYIDDVDPFNVLASIKHAEPTVPKKYSFSANLQLYDQVPALKKTLRAPHKVRTYVVVFVCLCLYAEVLNEYYEHSMTWSFSASKGPEFNNIVIKLVPC